MTSSLRNILFFLFLSIPFQLSNADENELTANELARALGVSWHSVILPGTAEDSYHVGTIIEYGDGRKAQRTGTIGIIKGGTIVKIFAQRKGEQIKCSIIAGGSSISALLDNPFNEYGNLMTSSNSKSNVFKKNFHLIKGSNIQKSSISCSGDLKPNEVGLRLYIKLQK